MKHKNFLPKKHTAKLVHRHHTAYGYLVLILVLVCIPLFVISNYVAAFPGDPGPMSASNGVFAVVPGPAPTTAPVIRSITNGQIFSTANLVPINGTCPGDTIIKIYKNQVMSGSDLCKKGSFAIQIDLFVGANSIVARAYNVNNIPGPDSDPVNVRLVLGASTSASQSNDPGGQLFVTSEQYFAGAHIKEALHWPFTISGGQAPYAVNIGWGDGKSDLISRGQAGTFNVEHTYDNAGQGDHNSYDITVQVTDQQGSKSFLHVVGVVSGGQPSPVGNAKAGYDLSSAIRIGWQLALLAVVIIFGFWIGEKYEVHILKKKYNIAP